jgi:hypothetical protein
MNRWGISMKKWLQENNQMGLLEQKHTPVVNVKLMGFTEHWPGRTRDSYSAQ